MRITDAAKTHDGDRYQFTSLGCVIERGQRVAGAVNARIHPDLTGAMIVSILSRVNACSLWAKRQWQVDASQVS